MSAVSVTRRSEPAPRRTRRTRALQALDTMPRGDCVVIALLLIEKLSLVETAHALDLPVATVRRRYDLALARVRRSLAPILARPHAGRRPLRELAPLRRVS